MLQLKNLIFNVMIWQSTLVSGGGDWMDAGGNVTIDSDAARRGLEVYKRIIDAGATTAGSTNYEYGEANAAFGSGQAATMLQWNAAFNELNDPEKTPMTAGKVWVAPMPAGSAGHKTHIHSLGIGMNKASQNKEDAGKFVAYLASEEAMEVYGKAGGTPPVPAVLEALAEQRPEFPLVGEHADQYGFVVNRRHGGERGADLRGAGRAFFLVLGRPQRPRQRAFRRRRRHARGAKAPVSSL